MDGEEERESVAEARGSEALAARTRELVEESRLLLERLEQLIHPPIDDDVETVDDTPEA